MRASDRRLSARLAYAAYRSGGALATRLPAPAAAAVAASLGRALPLALRDRRLMVTRHLRRVHGSALTAAEQRRQVRAVFDSYARYWLELFRLPAYSSEQVARGMSIEGRDHLDAALADERGVVLALPHLGNWDIAGLWFAAQGHRPLAVAEALDPPELFEWFVRRRAGVGVEIVPLGPDVGGAVLAALADGRPVALVADRDLQGSGVAVEFFGEETTLPAGPATLALRTGAPLVAAAAYFDGPRRHRVVVRPALRVAREGRFRDDAARVTQLLAHELEDLIRRAPEQWHLLQPNWPSDFAVLGIEPPGRRAPGNGKAPS